MLLKINYGGPDTIETADPMLIERYHETILIDTAPGPGTEAAPIPGTPTPDTFVSGDPLPSGPSVRLLFGPDNTWTIPADEHNTGDPGTTHHMTSCRTEVRYPFNPATGNSGTPSNP